MTFAIRRATAADYATIEAIVNQVTPEFPTSADTMAWQDATYPEGARFLAELDGRAAGVGTTGRIYMFQPDFDAYWGELHVLPDSRRVGVGSAIMSARSTMGSYAQP